MRNRSNTNSIFSRLLVIMAAILCCCVFSVASEAAVWKTTNQWNPEWEKRYEKWVKSAWKTDVFRNEKSPYFGLFPDCADTVYSMRVIFSAQYGLPFAVVDATNTKKILTNEMIKFDQVPEGSKRVVAFLAWFYDLYGTVNLPDDSYPVAVNREAIHPGILMLASESHHSYTVKEIRDNGVPTLFYSTQGNKGPLKARSWPSVSYLFSKGIHEPSGFRMFRYADDLKKPVWKVPGYSKEQYSFPAEKWVAMVQAKLANRNETVSEHIQRLMEDVCQLITTRVDLVNQAEEKKRENNQACLTAAEYDELSTPSRDGQTLDAFKQLQDVYADVTLKSLPIDPTVKSQLSDVFAESKSLETEQFPFCQVRLSAGWRISIGEYRRRLVSNLISANPNDSLKARWGQETFPTAAAKMCPSY